MSFNFENAMTKVSQTVGHANLTLGEKAPTIMFGAGIVGMVATAVLASRATLKIESVVDEMTELENKAKMVRSMETDRYTEEDYNKDLLTIRVQQAVKIGTLYLPAILVGGISIVLLTKSHRMLTERNAALMAAYATLDQGFKAYRRRVEEAYGPEKDREFLHGVETEIVEHENKKGEVKQVEVTRAGGTSPYGRIYDRSNQTFVYGSPEMNLAQLRMYQTALNHKLQQQGHLYLNEVYDQLGFDRTNEGGVVGWVLGSETGDSYVDFGIWEDDQMERTMDFMTGREDCIFLDFNVDGLMWDQVSALRKK